MPGSELRAQTPTPVLSGSGWDIVEVPTRHRWLEHGRLHRTWMARVCLEKPEIGRCVMNTSHARLGVWDRRIMSLSPA